MLGTMGLNWEPDILGEGYRCLTLDLGEDEEGPVSATLVGFTPDPVAESPGRRLRRAVRSVLPGLRQDPPPVHAIIYIHGWADYFFQTELADFFARRGVSFYALDLRKYGRSLRQGQTEGFVTDLAEYDADIEAAMAAVRHDVHERLGAGVPVRISLMAHSTGGLVASLWAHRNPGRIEALILNSPWLELRGSSMVRGAAAGLLEPLARMRPKARLVLPEIDFYWRSISREADGEWDPHPEWKPRLSFPVRAGWVSAVLAGHAQVAKGLDIRVPILLLASARSTIAAKWTPDMTGSDTVLDVSLMVQRGMLLGPQVSVFRFDGALHDVLLSARPVRELVYTRMGHWVDGFLLPRRP